MLAYKYDNLLHDPKMSDDANLPMSGKTYPVTKTPVTPNTRYQKSYSARNISEYIWDKFMHLTKRASWGIYYFDKATGFTQTVSKEKTNKSWRENLTLGNHRTNGTLLS